MARLRCIDWSKPPQEWRVLGIPPSEFVVANALRNALPEFLIASSETDSLAKFIADRQDNDNMRIFRLAS
jgi:hypothetical protein